MHSPDIRPLIPARIALPRGVYSYPDPDTHEKVYLAVDSRGGLLNGELRHRAPDETDAMIRRDLWRDLRRQDAVSDPPRPFALYVNGELRPSRASRPGPTPA